MHSLRSYSCLLALLTFSTIGHAAAPGAPQNVRVTVNTPYSALLEWDASASADATTRYLLTRNAASIGAHKNTYFLDNALLPERTFVYTVTALNAQGERSSPSSASVLMPAKANKVSQASQLLVPLPTGLRIERYSDNSLELFWDRVENAYYQYEVLRNDQLLTANDGSSFFDTLPVADATYRYQLIAIDQQGNRSSSASVSINATSLNDATNTAPTTSTIQIPDPESPTLSVYSDTAAELFWKTPTSNYSGLTQVEVFRDGSLMGLTDGTSYMDITRTRQDHQYRLVTVRNGSRSAGTTIPAKAPVADATSSTGIAAFRNATEPFVPRLPNRGNGLDVFLLNGQSNANPQFLNAMTDQLSARGFNFMTAHYYVGGQPLSTWINEDGTKALRWPIMMNVFDGATSQCESNPQAIRSITLVHYQGEADVNTTESLIAVANNETSPFKRRLSAFTADFTRHFQERCGITPNIVLATISFNEQHSLFPARLTGAHALIRQEITEVAREQGNVGAFDTFDLEHADHVHLKLYPESQAQFIAAERAINLFYKP